MARIRKGDTVEVISGNDKGKTGRVLRMIPKQDRLVIQGINLRWKHMRRSQQQPQGGRVRREVPIHESNVMLVDEATGKRTRVAYGVVDGKKVRLSRRTGKAIGTAAPVEEKKTKKSKAEQAKEDS